MLLPLCQLGRHARGLWSLAGVGVCALAMAGCQSVANAGTGAQLRVIDASPDAPALDIVPGSPSAPPPPTLYNVGFGTVSSYMQLSPGPWTHTAFLAGTGQSLANVRGSLASGGQYTLLASDVSANLHLKLLRDQSGPAPPGLVSVRFLGESPRMGAVDLYLVPAGASLTAGLAPAAANLAFDGNTGYRNLPAGTYSLVVLPAGASPAVATPLFTGNQTAYPSGSARTLVLIDSLGRGAALTGEVQVLAAADYDAPAS